MRGSLYGSGRILLLNLVADLERAQELRAQYDDYNPNNVTPQEAGFDAEIARIEQQLSLIWASAARRHSMER
jgi:hypothetical protein